MRVHVSAATPSRCAACCHFCCCLWSATLDPHPPSVCLPLPAALGQQSFRHRSCASCEGMAARTTLGSGRRPLLRRTRLRAAHSFARIHDAGRASGGISGGAGREAASGRAHLLRALASPSRLWRLAAAVGALLKMGNSQAALAVATATQRSPACFAGGCALPAQLISHAARGSTRSRGSRWGPGSRCSPRGRAGSRSSGRRGP